MIRVSAAVLAVGLFYPSVALADDKPKPPVDDPVAAELTKAKEAYQSAVKAASEKLLAAFDAEENKAEKNTKLSAEQYSKLSKQLAEEKKAFEADPSMLPKSPVMKVAASDFQQATARAKKPCETAFDAAAKAYRGKDKAALDAVLAQKEQFFKGGPDAADARRSWKGSRGTLVHIKDGEWHELPDAGQKFVFREVSRNQKYIELADLTRGGKGVYFRIEADKVLIKWPDKDRDWRVHAEGAWLKAK